MKRKYFIGSIINTFFYIHHKSMHALMDSFFLGGTKRGAAPDSYCLVWAAHMRATYCYEIQRIITYLGSVLLVALSQINVSFSHTFC